MDVDLLILFFTSLLFELVYTLWSWSVAKGKLLWAGLANMVMPFVALLPMVYIVDAKTWPERIIRCVPVGLAYALGTAAVMLCLRDHNGKKD